MKIYRPVVWLLVFYSLGFLAALYKSGMMMIPGTILVIGVTICLIYKHMRSQKMILLAALFLFIFGMFRGRICFQEQREGYLEPVENYTVRGIVASTQASDYGIKIVLKCKGYSIQLRGVSDMEITPGDRVQAVGTLEPLELAENPGTMNWVIYYKNKGIEYSMDTDMTVIHQKNAHWGYRLRWVFANTVYRMIEDLLPAEEAGLAAAMITGDRSEVDSEVQEIYRNSGIAHVIAISGLHIQILFGMVSKIMQKLLKKRKGAAASLVVIWIFCLLTGSSVSTVRACIMLTVRHMAVLRNRSNDEMSGLAAAAFCLLLYRPLYMMDAGFQLSFAACYGLMNYGILVKRCFFLPENVRRIVHPSVSVTLATLPITFYHYYQCSLYSVFLNLIVVPLMDMVLIMLLISVVLYMVWPSLAVWSIGIVHFILELYQKAGAWVLSLPGSIINPGEPPLVCIIIYYVLLGYLIKRFSKPPGKRGRNRSWVMATVLLLSWMLLMNTSQILFLSIGQGDCTVITVCGNTYVVDCGPGYEDVLKPYLKSRGIHRIDGVFVSHMDSDHCEGIYEMLQDESITVAALYLPEHSVHEIEDAWRSLPVDTRYWKEGDSLSAQGIRIQCIAPDPEKSYEDENEASMVLYIHLQNGKILMAGDMGTEAESDLLGMELGCDILKLGHHGSNTSSSEAFLRQVHPDMAWISCGENNRYGHPHEDVLERLRMLDIPYAVSYDTGAVWLDRKGIHGYKEAYRERWMD